MAENNIIKTRPILSLFLIFVISFNTINGAVFSVNEDVQIGSTLTQSLAAPAIGFHYTLFDGGDPVANSLFQISSTGKITVKKKLTYVVGERNSYDLIAIKRKDGTKLGGTPENVRINIVDVNDHDPVFKKSEYFGQISEGLIAGSPVQGLEDCFATDQDSSGIKNYIITSGNANNLFTPKVEVINGLKLLVIVTSGTLDREALKATPFIELQVKAVDGGNPMRLSQPTKIRIRILDKNDHSPVFEKTNWRATIQENSPVMTSVIKVKANDNDEGSNSQVYYYFEKLQNDFFIDPYTGVIYVAAPLSFTKKNSYKVTVVVTDRAVEKPLKSTSTVLITVVDVAGYPSTSATNTKPEFATKKLDVTIRGDMPVNAFVLIAKATDPDGTGNNNGQLTYTMTATGVNPFVINPTSGVISVKSKLPASTVKLDFEVTVKDGGHLTAKVPVAISIRLINTNKMAPLFKPSTLNVFIKEDIATSTQVFKAYAEDFDGLVYSITGGSGLGRFVIDANTGVVTPKVTFKSRKVYDLYVRATDKNTFKLSSTMYARVNVKHSDVANPVFSKGMYLAKIGEEESIGSFVTAVFAGYTDPSKKITYSVIVGPLSSTTGLVLDANTGIITTEQTFDYEVVQKKYLEVKAEVAGMPTLSAKTLVEVSIENKNDEIPVFSRSNINIQVPENMGYIPNLACLFATDRDGSLTHKLTYSITSGNEENLFSIDSMTGQLSVKNLDYEKTTAYVIKVQASDGAKTAFATVKVTVADDKRSPEPVNFGTYKNVANMQENTPSQTTIKDIAVVGSAGSFTCGFGFDATADVMSLFSVKTQATSCLVESTGVLKWTKKNPSYKFTIRAITKSNMMQFSTAELKVVILDLNDHTPVFTQDSYAASLSVSSKIGASVLTVAATDDDEGSNGNVRYGLLASSDSNRFNIDTQTGVVTVRDNLMSGKQYRVTVRASDQGSIQKSKDVQLLVSVHADGVKFPAFGSLDTAEISEDVSMGSVINAKATLAGEAIDYVIVGGNTGSVFNIDASGLVTHNQKLDYESKSEYKVVVRATKRGSNPPVVVEKIFTVKVKDANDNSPVFNVKGSSIQVTIGSNAPLGTVVSLYRAFDKDSGSNGKLKYSVHVQAGSISVPFTANADSGIVTTTQDITTTGSYDFILRASDQGVPVRSKDLQIKVTVVAGTKPPSFTEVRFKGFISDNTPVGRSVGSVSIKDNDPKDFIQYEIVYGNDDNSFCIDFTRTVYVQKPIDRDVTQKDNYYMTVAMKYKGRMMSTLFWVSGKDENDNSPVFKSGYGAFIKEIPESSPKGTFIYKVSATDSDKDLKGSVEYSLAQYGNKYSADKFSINTVTGEITLNNRVDYEKLDKHVITVKAADKATTALYALKQVIVKITDTNDEAPVFSSPRYEAEIRKDAKAGDKVLQVHASDLDSGQNGQVSYALTSDRHGVFKIDPVTGLITLKETIALVSDNSFNLAATATDKGDPTKRGQASVIVRTVTSDGVPKFALPQFEFNVPENTIMKGTATAISVDPLTYSIEYGNVGERFKIDKDTGLISSIQALDAEQGMNYTLIIKAKDTSERSSTTKVIINVKNINDNEPKFINAVNGLIEKVITSKVIAGEVLLTVQGKDDDVGDILTYEIVEKAQKEQFEIGANSGTIKLKKPLSSLIGGQNFAEFTVRATDRGTPKKSKDVKVRVVFANFRADQAKILKSVSETAAVSSSPVIVDLPRLYPLSSYQIVYPKVHPFMINVKTGEISLAQKLDYEKTQSYDLVIQENNSQDNKQYMNYKLGVSVLDANDNSPVFKMPSLKAKVNTNARIGTEVIKLVATDADSGAAGRVAFEIITPNVPFTVNPVTNFVEVSKMSSLTQPTYFIDVKASDGGIPKRNSDPVKLELTVVNEPPVFTKNLYKFSVSENANVDKAIGSVYAKSLSGIAVAYTIKSGNTGDKFRVDRKGNVILQRPLNYEDGPGSFSLVVEANEIASSALKSQTNVIIQVENVNDNPPRFTQVEYASAPISEDVAINTVVMTVTATDKDCGVNGVCTPGFLTYSTDAFTDTFRLDPITGQIRTVRALDWDKVKSYKFNVKVEDSGKIKRSAIAGVVITLKNVNDNKPVFNPDKKSIYISEVIGTGVVIAVVEAKDVDNDQLRYAFVSGNEKGHFAIDSSTGKITVLNSNFFDYSFILKISASDGKHTGHFTLTIYIDDKNDETPVFKLCSTYKPVVGENMPIGTQVMQVSASDNDQGRNGMIEYSLLQVGGKGGSTSGAAPSDGGSSVTNNFVINKDSGIITTNKKFDRETQAFYTVLAIARDGGPDRTEAERNSAACQLTIAIKDKNDMKPVFAIDNYEVSVWDGTPIDTVILQTSALDGDVGTNAKITYSLHGVGSEFKIADSTNGIISVGSSLKNKLATYNFQVQAANEGTLYTSSVNVKVTIKATKPPKFTQSKYSVRILESRSAGFEITSLQLKAVSESNLPNSKIVYSLPKGNLVQTNKDVFAINSETGMLKVAGELNYEVTKNYIVYVQAKDEANDMVTYAIVDVHILDVNDNTPLFHLPKYEYVTVTEGQGAGIVVGQVYASDKDSTTNAELTYNIVGTSDAFSIDSTTGKLTTKRTFDREKMNEDKITIHVKATDKGIPKQDSNVYVTVKIIDINDNPPVFVKSVYNGEIKEDAPVNETVLKIQATDKDAGDNAKVNFYVTGGNEQGHFSTSKSVFDKGTSTANIIVAKPLDRETKSQYKLTITASDSKFNVLAEVNIKVLDANDNAPKFLKPVYTGSIDEGSKSGVLVTTVSAVDKDTIGVQEPIKYKLGKDAGDMFVIDSTTGVITTGSKEFDREKKDEYRFTVIATDGKLEGTAIVKCTIRDINDEAPYFPGAPYTRYVEEHKPAGTVVGYVPAKDNDDPNAGGNAKITYSIVGDNKGFSIDKDSGLVKTLKEFNRETQTPVHKITVRATDGGVPVQKNETVVTIIISDTNDNDPKFTQSVFNGKITECAKVGTSVTKLTAKDNDDPSTVNAQLMYYVISSDHNAASYFHLDDRSGVITVAHGLDFEKSSKYKLTVGVKDRGVPMRPQGREETATVEIDVTDCNDNRPEFVPDKYKISVLENVKPGSVLLTVTATDKDKGSNGEFTFKVVDSEKNFKFGIKNSPANASKGIISLIYPMDREDIPYHVFKVSASDKGIPSLTGYADVNITLVDVNDNGPHFDKKDYCGKVEERKLGHQKVATIKVKDPDTTKYSCPCRFKIESGDEGLFELANAHSNSVEVVAKATAMFDREKKAVYTIWIAAYDQGNPPMKNTTFVKVEVLDKNDNEPSSGGSLSLLVNSYMGKFIGGVIGKIYIVDNDQGSNDVYEHTLTSQSPGAFFSVDAKTGGIIAAKNVPAGVYKLAFRSTEKNRVVGANSGKTVSSSAIVTVRDISEKQAKTSVAIRMTGLVKSNTCFQLMYLEFEELLAKILGVDKKRVTVFSVQEVKDLRRGVDIRFAVKLPATPGYAGDTAQYMDPSELIPLLNNKKKEIEKATGGKVDSVGIDPCAKETCQVGFCYNDIQPQRTFSVISDDNGLVPANPKSKTFISIDVKVLPICLAGPKKPKSCKDKPCLYGGKCTDLATGGYRCTCVKKATGPECQVNIRSFKTKNAYLWVKPLNYFYEGHLSFEFVTKEANGILLYQGPVSKIKSSETKDFMAVELVNGKLQIMVNQGDTYRIFKQTIASKEPLNDGVFHHVQIYKRGKFIRVTIDKCRKAMIIENSKGSHQDRSNCEITGTIGGPFKFINGMNPLQVGGIKRKDLKYPPLTNVDSFAGCIRNVYDNGIMYDLSKTIKENDVGNECPFFAKCPNCYNGVCRLTSKPFVCICDFGWTGKLCNERIKSYHYLQNSYSEYSVPKKRVKRLTWETKYTSVYKIQLRTKVDGYIVYEASSMTYGAKQEYSILEVVNKTLHYRFNVGDGAKNLILRNVNVGDGSWHNVTVSRHGNYATLEVQDKGLVSGTVGTHQLLDSNGVIYAGGVPSRLNIQGTTDMQGCLGDYKIGDRNLDDDPTVEVKRVNVEKSCPCLFLKCLNGGICMAGSPPYCICPTGYTGPDCSILISDPSAGTRAVMATGSLLGLVVIVVVFLLAVVLAALLLARKFAKKTVPVYVDDDPHDNIMPYHDEGAGEDDFSNYDLEKLLAHRPARIEKKVETEPLISAAAAAEVQGAAAGVVIREKKTRFEGLAAGVESVDVARFIKTRLAEADTEDAAYPRDTLLHYGYEGEGSDVDDLSELGDSEDESDDDDADFTFMQDWGAKFDNLNKIFNPPETEFDEDV
eukprot:gene18890-20792_t